MAGAMGGACMIGLGLALARPDKRVLVATGDGELLMNIGALATIAVLNPANLARRMAQPSQALCFLLFAEQEAAIVDEHPTGHVIQVGLLHLLAKRVLLAKSRPAQTARRGRAGGQANDEAEDKDRQHEVLDGVHEG